MKVKVLNENVSSSVVKNFKAYILGAIEYRREELDEVNTRVILRFQGTGTIPGIQGILVFDPTQKDKEDWIDNQGRLNYNLSDTKIDQNNGFIADNKDLKVAVTRIIYHPRKFEKNLVYREEGEIYVKPVNGKETFYTFKVESYN